MLYGINNMTQYSMPQIWKFMTYFGRQQIRKEVILPYKYGKICSESCLKVIKEEIKL